LESANCASIEDPPVRYDEMIWTGKALSHQNVQRLLKEAEQNPDWTKLGWYFRQTKGYRPPETFERLHFTHRRRPPTQATKLTDENLFGKVPTADKKPKPGGPKAARGFNPESLFFAFIRNYPKSRPELPW